MNAHASEIAAIEEWMLSTSQNNSLSSTLQKTANLFLLSMQYMKQEITATQYMAAWNTNCKELTNDKERLMAGKVNSRIAMSVLYFKLAVSIRTENNKRLFLHLFQESVELMYQWEMKNYIAPDEDVPDYGECPYQISERMYEELYLNLKTSRWKITEIWRMACRQYVLLEEARALGAYCPLRNVLFRRNRLKELYKGIDVMIGGTALLMLLLIFYYVKVLFSIFSSLMNGQEISLSYHYSLTNLTAVGGIIAFASLLLWIIENKRIGIWAVYRVGRKNTHRNLKSHQ